MGFVRFCLTRTQVKDKCIHELFEEQVNKTPDAIALIYEDNSLTYRDLNTQANQLAHYLQSKGVKAGAAIGLCFERSPQLIVAITAILKLNAIYVPLDSNYPQERLQFLIQDARLNTLLLEAENYTATEQVCSAEPQTRIVAFDEDLRSTLKDQPRHNLQAAIPPTHGAYINYTSGSTGTPKGVVVPHQAVLRLVCDTNYIDIQPGDRIGHAATVVFDAATFEIWGALLNGGTIVGIAQNILLQPRDLAAFLKIQNVTTLFLTTALVNQTAAVYPDAFASLKYLLFGGEAVNPQRIREILAAEPPQHLLHVYGPTENTTFSTWYPVTHVPEDATTIPIGKPIASTRCYVLGPCRQLVAVGVAGELYLGGMA
ncbi:MAG: AMP-binding protein [Cyanobacteria bacterium P01_H01_bin.15]